MKLFSSQTSLINFLLLLGMLILPFCGLLAYGQIHQLVKASDWVLHTEKVINVANYVLLNLTDAESRLNYYILSNDKTSIQDLDKLVNISQVNLKELKNLTQDNIIQSKRVNDLEILMNQKINLMMQLAKVENVKVERNALALATSQKRKELKQNITKAVTELNQQELNFLENRNNIVLREIKNSHLTFLIFGGLSEFLIILSFILLNYNQYHRNIAERKQAEAEKKLLQSNRMLQESDERYLLSTEGSSAGLWDWFVGTNKVIYSSYFKKMLGYAEEEFPNSMESFEKILHPSDYDRTWEKINQHLEKHVPFKIEYRLRSKTGQYKWIEAAGQALWNKDGTPTRMSGSMIDITERKKAEQRLRIQFAVNEILSEAASLDEISVQIIKEICEGFEWEFGIMWRINEQKNLLICIGTWHVRSPVLEEFAEETCKTKLEYGKGLSGNVWRHGKPIWFSDIETFSEYTHTNTAKDIGLKSAFAFPIIMQKKILGVIECYTREREEPDQRVLHLMTTIGLQIGQFVLRKESENALRKSEAYQTAILKSATDSIVTINDDKKIVSFNPQTSKEFNYSSSELKDQSIHLLIPSFDQLQGEYESNTNIELIGTRKNGDTFPIEVTIYEMNVNKEHLTVINIRNITERKRVDKIKNEFVSVVSHELRTPLTSIRGALGLILGGTTGSYSEKMEKLLNLANTNCDRLLALINDILDMEKIEAGKMSFQFKVIDISEIVNEAIEANKLFANKFNVKIQLQDSDHVDVNVDPDRLTQVLTNLLSNAVKFSPPGETVSLSIKRHNDRVRVSVTNKGIGIPPEFQPFIFQKFSQADTSDTRGKGGTGLGLSISKAIIEKLGGDLNFVSKANEETTFYFNLPIWIGRPKKAEDQQNVRRKERILLCEDDHDQAAYLNELLESAGFEVDVANTVHDAKKLLNANSYQILLLDLILPDQDGISFIRELRSSEITRTLPIIVLSVIAQTGKNLLNGEAFSVLDWIDKPIDFDKLMHAIDHLKKQTYPNLPKVLHVEDDPSAIEIMRTLLEKHAQVISVSTIKDTIEQLKHFQFDLLILDLLLPDGNAETLLPLISKYKIPVIIYSALEMDKILPKIVKHVLLKSETTNEELLSLVKHVLETSNT